MFRAIWELISLASEIDARRTQHKQQLPASADTGQAVITASELGEFVFCKQAWYLRRHRVARSETATRAIARGRKRHVVVGQQVDRVRDLESARGFLLMVAFLLAFVLLAWAFAGAGSVWR